ncbi:MULTISPECIES: hypothetical protein [Chromobacterium]|uniref:hypothetical protein n=1 Tax=Chromobacterium TaxID=535 RepID=UPI001375106B|nr:MULTISPECIES: hypothetical protein [Chromobacterium]WON85005.1 hypothetical protein OK026_05700 [Chromobacterium haemolyticum]
MSLRFVLALVGMVSAFTLAACSGDVSKNDTKKINASNAGAENNQKGVAILNGKAEVAMPKEFTKMPQSILDVKYPATSNRPQEAWFDAEVDGKVSFAFNLTNTSAKEEQLPMLAEALQNQMSAYSPVVKDVEVNGKKMMRLEMTTPAGDDINIFNVMQISSLDGKLLISTFNVTEDMKKKYAEMGKQVLSTLAY